MWYATTTFALVITYLVFCIFHIANNLRIVSARCESCMSSAINPDTSTYTTSISNTGMIVSTIHRRDNHLKIRTTMYFHRRLLAEARLLAQLALYTDDL